MADLIFRHKQKTCRLSGFTFKGIISPQKSKCSHSPQKITELPGFTNCATFSLESKCSALEIASELVATGLMVTEFNCLQPGIVELLSCEAGPPRRLPVR